MINEESKTKYLYEKIHYYHRFHWVYLVFSGVPARRINTDAAHRRTLVFVRTNNYVGCSNHGVEYPWVVIQPHGFVVLNWGENRDRSVWPRNRSNRLELLQRLD